MGSKGRFPPPQSRRPLPGSDLLHPEAFTHGVRPPPGAFPPFDLLPSPEVMEQKLAGQHAEIQKLATENQRFAATHGPLRQELAAAQHELQIVHAQIGAVKSEREQQARNLSDKISKMEAELKASEPIKVELQQAKAEAQNLIVTRQELISRVQHMSQDLQRAHADVQQVPLLMSELEGLRQEYQHCRGAYDYEKKLYTDHLESLQVMEKNYITMARELEKLRAELTNTASLERRHVAPPYGTTQNNETEASGHPAGQSTYEDGYGVAQGRGQLPATAGVASSAGATAYTGPQTGSTATRPNYDAARGSQRGPSYEGHRGSIYDSQRPGYDGQRGPGYNVTGLPTYDATRGAGYDAQSRGAAGHALPGNTAPYDSSTPPGRGGGFEAPARGGGNPGRR